MLLKVICFFIFLIGLFSQAMAVTQVGFVTSRDVKTGNYERYHVFISNDFGSSQWIHAYPPQGVVEFDDLNRIFRVSLPRWEIEIEIFSADEVLSSKNVFRENIGKGFDESYRWKSKNTTYCSKYVGTLLGLKPTQFYNDLGRKGISVNEIYHFVKTDPRFRRSQHLVRDFVTPFRNVKVGGTCEMALKGS